MCICIYIRIVEVSEVSILGTSKNMGIYMYIRYMGIYIRRTHGAGGGVYSSVDIHTGMYVYIYMFMYRTRRTNPDGVYVFTSTVIVLTEDATII